MLTSLLLAVASTFGGCDKPAFTTFTFPKDFKVPSFAKFDFNSFGKADVGFDFVNGEKDVFGASAFGVKENFLASFKAEKAFSFEKTDVKFDFVKGSKDAFELKASKDGEVKAAV